MFVYLEKSYIFALLLFGCKNPSVRNVFSISFPLRVLMSKFFFSFYISCFNLIRNPVSFK